MYKESYAKEKISLPIHFELGVPHFYEFAMDSNETL